MLMAWGTHSEAPTEGFRTVQALEAFGPVYERLTKVSPRQIWSTRTCSLENDRRIIYRVRTVH